MTCIIAYDIENDGIRNKLSHFLEKKGTRLQKSVFAIEIERHSFKGFLRQMERIVGKNGKIAVFRLCAGCYSNSVHNMMAEKSYYVF